MMRIAVLKGGRSDERDVSLVTGTACAAGLRCAGFTVAEIDVGPDVVQRIAEAAPDVCFNALHGSPGEDGSIQGLLNVLAIPYTHSGVAASAVAMDKRLTKAIASHVGLRSPAGQLIGPSTFWEAGVGHPYVIKPAGSGSSINTFVVREPETAPFARGTWPFRGQALLEEFIEGAELTVTVLDGEPLTVTEIVPLEGVYDYAAKYTPGQSRHIIPANIPKSAFDRCLEQALVIHEALGCRGISRSDFILDQHSGELFFLEINTQPGMTPTSLAPEQALHAGIGFPELMRRLVRAAATDAAGP